jgi:hypothetical protein
MMKKLLGIICAGIVAFSLAACGGASPSDAVDHMLKAVKSQDTDTVKSYYDGDVDSALGDITSLFNQKASKDLTDDQKAILKKLTDKLLDFDYSVGEEKINGDTATVSVKFTTYKFGSMFDSMLSEYMQKAFTYAFSDTDLSDEKTEELLYDSLEKQLDQLKEKNYTKTVDINLKKTDDGWKIKKLNGDEIDAITGGVYSTMETWSKAFGSGEDK